MPSNLLPSLRCAVFATLFAASPLCAQGQDAASVSDLLKRQTQSFSDAGQRGDGAAMAAVLDDRVVFFNEGGDVATKADMASSTPTPHPGVTSEITVTDWHCELHGDVAVTSFVDDLKSVNHGEPFHARYRSVETWHKSAAGWLMIASETIALNDDPPAVALAPALLAQYVGTYRDTSGNTFIFTRDGDHIVASVNGGAKTAQSAEVADVLFTPTRYRVRKVFQRDGAGMIIGFNLRSEGHDRHFAKV